MKRVYKGYTITRGRTYQDYCVSLNGIRTRYGTLAEIMQDIDDWINGALPEPQRGGFDYDAA